MSFVSYMGWGRNKYFDGVLFLLHLLLGHVLYVCCIVVIKRNNSASVLRTKMVRICESIVCPLPICKNVDPNVEAHNGRAHDAKLALIDFTAQMHCAT